MLSYTWRDLHCREGEADCDPEEIHAADQNVGGGGYLYPRGDTIAEDEQGQRQKDEGPNDVRMYVDY
jgi:hypothetical protein